MITDHESWLWCPGTRYKALTSDKNSAIAWQELALKLMQMFKSQSHGLMELIGYKLDPIMGIWRCSLWKVTGGSGIVGWQAKPPSRMPTSRIGLLVWVQAAPLQSSFLSMRLGGSRQWPKYLGFWHLCRRPVKSSWLSYWLQPVPDPALCC